MLHGKERQMSELSVEELQSNINACQSMFPKWKSGYNVILAGANPASTNASINRTLAC